MNARVTILHDVVAESADRLDSAGPDATADTFDAEVLVLKQPLMELRVSQPNVSQLDRGTAIRIDTSDAVWLGETEECSASGDGYSIRVRLRHVLRDFETLARLAERFGTAAPKGALQDAPKGTAVQI
jgi:hypothetical protein